MPGPTRVPNETPKSKRQSKKSSENITSGLDPIPDNVRTVLNLFDDQLAGVSFPGLDASVLQSHADTVKERADDLDDARRALEEARIQLEHSQESLMIQAKKGLAYASVFAESDPNLQEALAGIHLGPGGAKKTAKKKATKKAAKAKASDELPLAGPVTGTSDAPAPDPTPDPTIEYADEDVRLAG